VHVAGRRAAQAVAERALVDARADRLAGAGDGLDQQAQVGIDQLLVALPLDQELRQVDAPHGGILREPLRAYDRSPFREGGEPCVSSD